MTNAEILEKTIESQSITEVIHTYATWNSLGYNVKKGEKASYIIEMWKPCKTKEIGLTVIESEVIEGKFFLKKCHFFKKSQVEIIS